ncbi:hypothetical protein JD969_08105 [Planctomycetota bacterium]|nr:hypothetical protein JD969_08105 [Planctomycetota bacterium]
MRVNTADKFTSEEIESDNTGRILISSCEVFDMSVTSVVIFVAACVVVYVASCFFDKDRVRKYVSDRGGNVLEIHWVLFGTGWFGDKNRIYSVTYVDADNNTHHATVKTSMLAGVYFTDDQVIEYAVNNTFGAVDLEPDVRELAMSHVGERLQRLSDMDHAEYDVDEYMRLKNEYEEMKASYEIKLAEAHENINVLKDKNKKLTNELCKVA